MSLRSTYVRLGAIASVALLAPMPSFTEEATPGTRTVLVHGPAALAVTSAVGDAVNRLRDPACQQVLDDFAGEDGRPLRAALGSTAPDDYMAQLVLREGEIPRGSGHCVAQGAAAFTAGGAAVFVCGRSFQRLGRSTRACALIHEMLHTLGLRENPPSSAEIQQRVAERCGG
jgi:hypothetical protein